MPREILADAGNTLVPLVLTLRTLGFTVRRETHAQAETWIAESESIRLVAAHPSVLLGLATMRKLRGPNWRATDAEIAAILKDLGFTDEAGNTPDVR